MRPILNIDLFIASLEAAMCLHPRPVDPVPEETARVARAAFPRGNTYMKMRDELGVIFEDEDFAGLFPRRGQPAMAPWRLALVTVVQFAEDLSDRRAADAVRGRIDLKYALSLELSDPGFDASVLSEFRARLVEGGAQRLPFDLLLGRFREMGLVKGRGKQRIDSTHVLAAVRCLNRLELAGPYTRRSSCIRRTPAAFRPIRVGREIVRGSAWLAQGYVLVAAP